LAGRRQRLAGAGFGENDPAGGRGALFQATVTRSKRAGMRRSARAADVTGISSGRGTRLRP
jgi:hypothetical protein